MIFVQITVILKFWQDTCPLSRGKIVSHCPKKKKKMQECTLGFGVLNSWMESWLNWLYCLFPERSHQGGKREIAFFYIPCLYSLYGQNIQCVSIKVFTNCWLSQDINEVQFKWDELVSLPLATPHSIMPYVSLQIFLSKSRSLKFQVVNWGISPF